MKRLFKFQDLSPSLQSQAIAKVSRLAALTAREHGEIWIEPAPALAQAATFTVTRYQGEITGIWNVRFARTPKIMPGTERRSLRLSA